MPSKNGVRADCGVDWHVCNTHVGVSLTLPVLRLGRNGSWENALG